MGKILFPKQHGHTPGHTGATSSRTPRVDRLTNTGQESAHVPSDSAQSLNVRLNGAAFVSACPVCQQCFRSYVSMSQHCRTTHGLRPSDGAFSRYPGKFDACSGPPLEANSVAAHVANNLTNWLHGKKSHLLAPQQCCSAGEAADAIDRTASDLASNDVDKWLAEKPVRTAVGEIATRVGADNGDADTSSPSCAAGPPVLMKMHDDPAVSAGCTQPPLSDSPPVLQKCIEHVKQLTFYDEAGAWKFVCLVCFNVYADKEVLHGHQISSHPNVACTHLEVEAGHAADVLSSLGKGDLSAAKVSTSPSRRVRRQIGVKAELYSCVACKKKWRSLHLLHEHILACAESHSPAATPLSAPLAPATSRAKKASDDLAAVAPMPPPAACLVASAADSSVWRYGNKRKRYRKHHVDL